MDWTGLTGSGEVKGRYAEARADRTVPLTSSTSGCSKWNGCQDQRCQVPGDNHGKEDIDPAEQALPATLPAVEAQRNRQPLHDQQSPQRMRSVAERKANHRIAFPDSVDQKCHSG